MRSSPPPKGRRGDGSARYFEPLGSSSSNSPSGSEFEIFERLLERHHVGVLRVHVGEIDRVRRLRAVEAAFLDHLEPVVVAERVDHRAAHAPRGGRAGDDQGVRLQHGEVAHQPRAEEGRRLLLADHDVLRAGRDLVHDLVAVAVGALGLGQMLVRALVLVGPGARVPAVDAPVGAGGVDHRDALGAALVDQLADDRQRLPRVLAARGVPALDRFEDRLRLFAAEIVVHVDDQERGALAHVERGAEPAGGEYLLVALGEKLVPDPFRHLLPPSVGIATISRSEGYVRRRRVAIAPAGRDAAGKELP